MKMERSLGIWAVVFLLIFGSVVTELRCKNNTKNTSDSATGSFERRVIEESENPPTGRSSPLLLPGKRYAELADKAQKGDPEAAYDLYDLFTFEVRDYGLAYFWCLKAKELGHPKVTERNVRMAEGNVLSYAAAQSDDEPAADDTKWNSLPSKK